MSDVKKKKHIIEWIQLLVSLVYVFNPIDIIPDMPAIGWVDDFFVVAFGMINLVQGYTNETNKKVAKIIKILKWIIAIFGIICIIFILFLGSVIIKIFQ